MFKTFRSLMRKQRGYFLINPFMVAPTESYLTAETASNDYILKESETVDYIQLESFDLYFDTVQLLLHTEGQPQSDVIIDSSNANRAPAVNTGVKLSNAQSKFGRSSLFCDGSSYLSYGSSTAFNTAQNNFCFECYVYPTSSSASDRYIAGLVFSDGGYQFDWWIRFNNGQLYANVNDGGFGQLIGANQGLDVGVWSHIALFRHGSTFYLTKNGIIQGTATFTMGHSVNSILTIGGVPGWSGLPFLGYIDEARYTVGNHRYTGEFTPATNPFTNY